MSVSGKNSVTFVNLARSGALIKDIESQLNELDTLKGVRKVDVVFISIGGNDAGFENAIAAYLLREPIDNFPDIGPSLDDIKKALNSGNWTSGSFTDVGSVFLEVFDWAYSDSHEWRNRIGLNGLEIGYQDVANAFERHSIDQRNIFILQYPDPFVADLGHPENVCPGPVLTAVASVLGRRLEIGRKEQKHAQEHLVSRLNGEIATSAERWGWNIVPGESAFYNHAICQGDERMVVLNKESFDLQGDKKGTLHPNKNGFHALGIRAYEAWFRAINSNQP